MPAFELLLPLGAIGLYLFDSALLLYSNEFLFLRRSRGWSFAWSPAFLLAGRRVYIPNPLTPGTPQLRVRWSEADPRREQEQAGELDRFFRALRPVQYLVSALLILLLAVPVELLLYGTGIGLLAVMAAFYLVTLATLICIFARRRELQVSGRWFLALCFDSLACAPFAINLVRKLALRRTLVGNPIAFAGRTFEPAVFSSLLGAVSRRVSEEQQRENGQTPRWSELEAYRSKLAAMTPEVIRHPAAARGDPPGGPSAPPAAPGYSPDGK
jgi:hypothetical protein